MNNPSPGARRQFPGETRPATETQREDLKAIIRNVYRERAAGLRNGVDGKATDPSASALSENYQGNTTFNGETRRSTVNNPEIKAKVDAALALLKDARDLAERCQRNAWEFAVEISEFTDRGIGRNVLRLLVWQSLIEHRTETTEPGESNRSFQEQDLAFSSRSCFVLTDNGRQAVNPSATLSLGHNVNTNPNGRPPEDRDRERRLQPYWDENLRQLKLGDQVVKSFKWPAANQEKVIRAFQEEGWPVKIDDPLPPSNDVCPKRRLHDTIKCLNRKQVHPGIRFHGDGTGQGVMIEIIPDTADDKE